MSLDSWYSLSENEEYYNYEPWMERYGLTRETINSQGSFLQRQKDRSKDLLTKLFYLNKQEFNNEFQFNKTTNE